MFEILLFSSFIFKFKEIGFDLLKELFLLIDFFDEELFKYVFFELENIFFFIVSVNFENEQALCFLLLSLHILLFLLFKSL